MTRKYLPIVIIAFAVCGGCAKFIISEPYPAFTYEPIEFVELPKQSQMDFLARNMDAEISKVSRQVFKGKVVGFVIWFKYAVGNLDVVEYNVAGEPTVDSSNENP